MACGRASFHARHDILFASLFVTSFTVNGKRFDVEGSPHKTGSWDTTGDGHKDTTDFDVTGTHDRLHLFSLGCVPQPCCTAGDGNANVRVKGHAAPDHVAFWPQEARSLRLSPTDAIEFEATTM